jgi:hypothetical protein
VRGLSIKLVRSLYLILVAHSYMHFFSLLWNEYPDQSRRRSTPVLQNSKNSMGHVTRLRVLCLGSGEYSTRRSWPMTGGTVWFDYARLEEGALRERGV